MAASQNGAPSTPKTAPALNNTKRNMPYLPTPREAIFLALFPTILLFGTLFSVLSPQTRAAPYDSITQAHLQDPSLAPSYFARKSNIFNTLFVKRGWGWTTFAFFFFILTHPFHGPVNTLSLTPRRLQAGLRWLIVTIWWFLVTQWFFGPAIIDRGFRWTGGKCDLVETKVALGEGDSAEVFTAVACKAVGGRWSGGHDISGHVFLLVLASGFLLQEVGWAAVRSAGRREERSVIMTDGAIKSATVESQGSAGDLGTGDILGIGGKTALGVVGLSCWMLLMTAIYFHTWFEKVSTPAQSTRNAELTPK
jgi:hypothetical protein